MDLDHQEKGEVIEQLMNLYVEKVYLLAYFYVMDQGITEDISQEVLFRGEASLKSSIYQITVNTSFRVGEARR